MEACGGNVVDYHEKTFDGLISILTGLVQDTPQNRSFEQFQVILLYNPLFDEQFKSTKDWKRVVESLRVPVLSTADVFKPVLCLNRSAFGPGALPPITETIPSKRSTQSIEPVSAKRSKTVPSSDVTDDAIPPTPQPKNMTIREAQKSPGDITISTKSLFHDFRQDSNRLDSFSQSGYDYIPKNAPPAPVSGAAPIAAPVAPVAPAAHTYQDTFQTQQGSHSLLDSFMDDILGLDASVGLNPISEHVSPVKTKQSDRPAPAPPVRASPRKRNWRTDIKKMTVEDIDKIKIDENEPEVVEEVIIEPKKKKGRPSTKKAKIVPEDKVVPPSDPDVIPPTQDEPVNETDQQVVQEEKEKNDDVGRKIVDTENIQVAVEYMSLCRPTTVSQPVLQQSDYSGIPNFKRFRKGGGRNATINRINLIPVVPASALE